MVASAGRVRSASSGVVVVRAEQQLRDDAAVAIPQAADYVVPQGAVHQHPVEQHHDRPVAAAVGVHEAGGRRPLELHDDFLAARSQQRDPRRRSGGEIVRIVSQISESSFVELVVPEAPSGDA